MSNDPWEVQEQEARIYFAQSQVERIEKTGSNGNTYFEMKVYLTPIEEGKQIIERTYIDFNTAWQHVTIPSVQKLAQDGKIQQPKDMEKLLYVSYRWTEHRSYAQRDIQYWKKRDPDKLSVDEQSRTYKAFVGLEFLDVFPDETTWRTAYEADNPVVENGNDLPDPALDAAKEILPTMVESCGTDLTALQERLKHPPLNVFNINSPEVRQAVAHYVATKAGTDAERQDEKLAEINNHFSSDTPYMTTESAELVAELGEIAFS
jgi:hypothetical protein